MTAPLSFDYHRPRTLEAALALLGELGASARVLAGGTDLIDRLRRGSMEAAHLVSITCIDELREVRFDDAGGLEIGAAARIREVGRHAEVVQRYPALAHACSVMATTNIRNMGTVGGNIVNGSSCADTAGPLLVHGATVTIANRGGRRQVDLERFFRGPKEVDLAPGELVVSLRLPVPAPASGSAYDRISARSRVDMAAASVAGYVVLDASGTMNAARVAVGAVAPTPMLIAEAERRLVHAGRSTTSAPPQSGAGRSSRCWRDACLRERSPAREETHRERPQAPNHRRQPAAP